jgi:hypothetical protein
VTRSNQEPLPDFSKWAKNDPARREDPKDLPGWVKMALIHKVLYSETVNNCAKRFKRKGSTLSKYISSPAAKKWIADIEDIGNNPVALAKAVIREHMLSVAMDRVIFLEMAKDAGDYVAADRIAADLMDRGGITKKIDTAGAVPQLTLVLQSPKEMEPILIESEVVEDD